MLFAYKQLSVIYNLHGFIFMRPEATALQHYGFVQDARQSGSPFNIGNIHTTLSKRIAGDLRHSDVVCVALVVLKVVALYIFLAALGQMDSRKNK